MFSNYTMSQLVRYARVCSDKREFKTRNKLLSTKLERQGFKKEILEMAFVNLVFINVQFRRSATSRYCSIYISLSTLSTTRSYTSVIRHTYHVTYMIVHINILQQSSIEATKKRCGSMEHPSRNLESPKLFGKSLKHCILFL